MKNMTEQKKLSAVWGLFVIVCCISLALLIFAKPVHAAKTMATQNNLATN